MINLRTKMLNWKVRKDGVAKQKDNSLHNVKLNCLYLERYQFFIALINFVINSSAMLIATLMSRIIEQVIVILDRILVTDITIAFLLAFLD